VEQADEEAYFELSFSPNVRLVSTVRRFVSEFYAKTLADAESTSRLAVATHELLENAVRYSVDGNTTIRTETKSEKGAGTAVSIETRNRASATNAASIRGAVAEIASAPDASAHYQMLMRRSAKRTEGSGLGLGRVHAETGLALTCEIDGDVVRVRAGARFEGGRGT